MNTSRLAQWGEAAGFFVPEWIVFLGAAGFFIVIRILTYFLYSVYILLTKLHTILTIWSEKYEWHNSTKM
jgi:hypothetical protein